MKLAKRISLLRHEHDYGEDYVACKLNLKLQTYLKMEAGEVQINKRLAYQLATLYHMSLLDLLGDEPLAVLTADEREADFAKDRQHTINVTDQDIMTYVKTEISAIKQMLQLLISKVNEMN